MGTADLHIHTLFSDGTASVGAVLHHASTHTDLDVIAITDHDTLDGAKLALDMAVHFRVQVVPGMEISTREGHLLALYLETPVKPGMSYVETAQQVRLFGGLPIAAHPTDTFASSVGADRLRQIAERYPGLLAGIEAENGAVVTLGHNRSAGELRWELTLSGLGNSDAHLLSTIGSGRTIFSGCTAQELRVAIEKGEVVPLPVRRPANYFRQMALRFSLRFGLGFADWLEMGEGAGRRVRLQRPQPPA